MPLRWQALDPSAKAAGQNSAPEAKTRLTNPHWLESPLPQAGSNFMSSLTQRADDRSAELLDTRGKAPSNLGGGPHRIPDVSRLVVPDSIRQDLRNAKSYRMLDLATDQSGAMALSLEFLTHVNLVILKDRLPIEPAIEQNPELGRRAFGLNFDDSRAMHRDDRHRDQGIVGRAG